MQRKTKFTLRNQTSASAVTGGRRFRTSQQTEGTMTNKPSQLVWRTVPSKALEMEAAISQSEIGDGCRVSTGRRQRYGQTTIANMPGISDMELKDRGMNRGESTSVRVAKVAF